MLASLLIIVMRYSLNQFRAESRKAECFFHASSNEEIISSLHTLHMKSSPILYASAGSAISLSQARQRTILSLFDFPGNKIYLLESGPVFIEIAYAMDRFSFSSVSRYFDISSRRRACSSMSVVESSCFDKLFSLSSSSFLRESVVCEAATCEFFFSSTFT